MNDTLFRVKTTWANKGRIGSTDCVVVAPDAVTALTREWGKIENPDQLRTVEIEWLCPVDCVRDLMRDEA